jgi:hypothetical protein
MQTNFTEPTKHNSGLFVVDWEVNFVHWLAWREWFHAAFDKQFFPQRLTTMFAWPPASSQGASAVAEQIKGYRDAVGKESGIHTGLLKAVPMIVMPWQEWSSELKRSVAESELRRRREWENDKFDHAPKYPWAPRFGFRWPAPMAHAVKTPRMHPLRRIAAE